LTIEDTTSAPRFSISKTARCADIEHALTMKTEMAEIILDGFPQIPSSSYLPESRQVHMVVEIAFVHIRYVAVIGVFEFHIFQFLSNAFGGVNGLRYFTNARNLGGDAHAASSQLYVLGHVG
jgi:hypothetical protein